MASSHVAATPKTEDAKKITTLASLNGTSNVPSRKAEMAAKYIATGLSTQGLCGSICVMLLPVNAVPLQPTSCGRLRRPPIEKRQVLGYGLHGQCWSGCPPLSGMPTNLPELRAGHFGGSGVSLQLDVSAYHQRCTDASSNAVWGQSASCVPYGRSDSSLSKLRRRWVRTANSSADRRQLWLAALLA
jgi:hypothetical protein